MILFKRSTWLHLRIPFSYYLTPIMAFPISLIRQVEGWRILIVFIAIHVFLYPASNGYNSYYDRDEDSIGGLRKPPPVTRELLWAALAFDGVALVLGALISDVFVFMMLLYGLCSKAYSHERVRLKRYPVISWLGVGLIQGSFTFCMIVLAVTGQPLRVLRDPLLFFGILLSAGFLLASYPMTQVYQHRADHRRGDRTLSMLLGIRGTFGFTAAGMLLVSSGFLVYFNYFF